MNSRQRKTPAAIFKKPTPTSLEWKAIESLFVAIGCKIIEGSGSRVRFVFDNNIAAFHRPHPDKNAKQYQVREAKAFLIQIGVKP